MPDPFGIGIRIFSPKELVVGRTVSSAEYFGIPFTYVHIIHSN